MTDLFVTTKKFTGRKNNEYEGITIIENQIIDKDTLYQLGFTIKQAFQCDIIRKPELQDCTGKGRPRFKLPKQEKPEQAQETRIPTTIKEQKQVRREKRIQGVLLEEKPKYQSLGCGIHQDVYYFGTKVYEDSKGYDAVVTSDKKIYVAWKNHNEIKDIFDLQYKWSFFEDSLEGVWSNKSIRDWLYGELEEQSFRANGEQLKAIYEKHIYFVDARIYKFVTCDNIANYFTPLWQSKGRQYSKAEKRSGKTNCSLIYVYTTFNPFFSSDFSPAFLFRVVESTCCTAVIDDFDELPEEPKKAIIQLARTGYKRGIKVGRISEGRTRQPQTFNLFSGMCINNTMGLDKITIDRCNTIRMLRTNKQYPEPKETETTKKIRDNLHILALQSWKGVKKQYEELEVSELTSRELERVKPILTIAKLIGEDWHSDILSWILEENQQQSIRDLRDDWEFLLLDEINRQLLTVEQNNENHKWFQVKTDLTENLAIPCLKPAITTIDGIEKPAPKDWGKQKKGLSSWIGKYLSAIPIFTSRMVKGRSQYKISREQFDAYIDAKGFAINENNELDVRNASTSSTSSTTSTSSTSSTTQIQKKVEDVEWVEQHPLMHISQSPQEIAVTEEELQDNGKKTETKG